MEQGYIKIIEELPIFLKVELRKLKGGSIQKPKRILVVDTCLIGDFMATLPALHYFIKKNKAEIDLVVSPPIKPLAERIRGINKVFLAKSIYERKIESKKEMARGLEAYDHILIMRISPDSYRLIKNVKFKSMQTYSWPYLRYAFHLAKTSLKKEDYTKPWREVNFEITGENVQKKIPRFDKIFKFNKADYAKIERLPEMKLKGKKVLIHTSANWSAKSWEISKWVELLNRIRKLGRFEFIFVGSGPEWKDFKKIQKRLDFKIHSLIRKINLKDLMTIMRLSDYFIGIDSGPRNMAHIADIPSVTLLGPGPKMFAPLKKRDIALASPKRDYTVFSFLRKNSYPKKIGVEKVFEGFEKLAGIKHETF